MFIVIGILISAILAYFSYAFYAYEFPLDFKSMSKDERLNFAFTMLCFIFVGAFLGSLPYMAIRF